jgi:hypothetical protein
MRKGRPFKNRVRLTRPTGAVGRIAVLETEISKLKHFGHRWVLGIRIRCGVAVSGAGQASPLASTTAIGALEAEIDSCTPVAIENRKAKSDRPSLAGPVAIFCNRASDSAGHTHVLAYMGIIVCDGNDWVEVSPEGRPGFADLESVFDWEY